MYSLTPFSLYEEAEILESRKKSVYDQYTAKGKRYFELSSDSK